ncbi:MAG: aldehyde ferredoxin oxidoreductase family protein [Candidatus Baldrarchaeia archaeon]
MSEIFGWTGRALLVDLSTGITKRIELEREVLLKFMGGRGLGAKIVYDGVDPRTDPFHRDNILVFAVGPLTATKVYTSGRYCVVSKSPLTGGLFYSSSGGFFGASLKKAGYDAIIIRGRASDSVYLYIDDEEVKLEKASHLWGKGTKEVREILKRDLGREFRVVCIGPAGENLVRYACIVNDISNAAGRGGLGAVMGSKNLKAIAVRGSRKVRVADPDALNDLMEKAKIRVIWNPILDKALAYYGTSSLVNIINEHGMLPTRNFQLGYFEEADAISGETLRERIFVKRASCYNCPVACKRITRTKSMGGEGPEYETIGSLGSMLMIGDIEKVAEINYLCNDLGLDTISTGVTIACAMELSERGVIDEKIEWGDAEKVKELVGKIAAREGIGNELAEGSKRFAEKYGMSECAMHVKGLELAMYDPRGAFGQALSYATSNRGGCHLNAYMIAVEVLGVPYLMDRFSPTGKPPIVVYLQNLAAAIDSMVLCKFMAFEFDDEMFANFLSAVTGENYTQETVVKTGERIWNLERVFNIRAGIEPSQDTLPSRLLSPLQNGPCKGKVPPLRQMLQEYYYVRGWREDGIPTAEKLKELGIEPPEGWE